MKSGHPVGAASATYRKAVNKVAKTLRVPAKHTRYPSEDFERVTDLIDGKARERALRWYKKGIRRGFIEACDVFLDGQLEFKGGTLYCPPKIIIGVKVKFRGERWQTREFKFKAENLGFE